MPRVPIDEQHRTGEGGSRFPKLKLDKGQYARFALLEQPWCEWVHVIKAPVIEHGVAKKKEGQRKTGETYETYDLEFISQPFCIGSPDVLDEHGVDEANCPVCAASKEDPNLKPSRRYAANIVRYRLRGATWEPMVPLSLEVIVWTFTARMYDNLLDLQKEIGDLRRHDIRLECEDGMYQRMKMMFSLDPAWRAFENGSDLVKQAWNEPGNRATDEQLRDLCGREASRTQMQDDVNLCLRRWRQATAAGGDAGTDVVSGQIGGQAKDLSSGLDDLLGGTVNPAVGGMDEFSGQADRDAESAARDAESAARSGGADPLASVQPTPAALAPNGSTTASTTQPAAGDPLASTQSAPPSEQPAPEKKSSFDDLLSGI